MASGETTRLLKLGHAFPLEHLREQQSIHASEIASMDYSLYYRWLMSIRNYTYDCFTFPMREAGWDARDLIVTDQKMLELVERDLLKCSRSKSTWGALQVALRDIPVKTLVSGNRRARLEACRRQWRIEQYIEKFQPHVLFLQEPTTLGNRMFEKYKDRCLIVGLVGCNLRYLVDWMYHRCDAMLDFTSEYHHFTLSQGIPSFLIEYGVDERLAEDLSEEPISRSGVVFVGGLRNPEQRTKRELMQRVAEVIPEFQWWGHAPVEERVSPELMASHRGLIGGTEMLKLYQSSLIVLNDYVDTAVGVNLNLRTKEILATGGLMLTRYAPNIEWLEKAGGAVCFHDADDCIRKIRYYLDHPAECEAIAARGHQLGVEKFGYRKMVPKIMAFLSSQYQKKFGRPLQGVRPELATCTSAVD
ncbi:MAG: glycosyltransferase [Pirellulaceae bacterium]|jgi:hypothetical protein